ASGGLTLDQAGRTLSAYSDTASGLSAGTSRMYIYATFDKNVTASNASGVSGFMRFDVSNDKVVTMRIATSLISAAQAQHNLDLEVGNDSFDTVKTRAQQLWDAQLGVIDVEGATADQLMTLYSNLYRLFLYPNSQYENTGTAAAPVYQHA